jgi:perosamine synthetase
MIQLTRPLLGPEEAAATAAVLASGRLVQGEQVGRFERMVANVTGRQYAIAVSSGTTALRLALQALGIGEGDSVLVPDLTWPSPAHAVLEVGAYPVLVDVDAREWNVTPRELSHVSRYQLRAAIVIDQFGNPARVRALSAVLQGVPLIVDAACSLGSHTGDEACGAAGDIACLSFHPRKVLTTGEGGMCLTDDPDLAQRLAELRNHGQRGPGIFGRASGNHRLSELAAAVGVVQLGRLSEVLEVRAAQARRYAEALSQLPRQHAPEGMRANHQTYAVVLPESHDRDQVIASMRARGIECSRLSYALHELPQLAQAAALARERGELFTNSTWLARCGLALPLWPGLSQDDQQKVINELTSVLT